MDPPPANDVQSLQDVIRELKRENTRLSDEVIRLAAAGVRVTAPVDAGATNEAVQKLQRENASLQEHVEELRVVKRKQLADLEGANARAEKANDELEKLRGDLQKARSDAAKAGELLGELEAERRKVVEVEAELQRTRVEVEKWTKRAKDLERASQIPHQHRSGLNTNLPTPSPSVGDGARHSPISQKKGRVRVAPQNKPMKHRSPSFEIIDIDAMAPDGPPKDAESADDEPMLIDPPQRPSGKALGKRKASQRPADEGPSTKSPRTGSGDNTAMKPTKRTTLQRGSNDVSIVEQPTASQIEVREGNNAQPSGASVDDSRGHAMEIDTPQLSTPHPHSGHPFPTPSPSLHKSTATPEPQPNTDVPASSSSAPGAIIKSEIKVKKEALILPPVTVQRYLADAPTFTIPGGPPSTLHVRRKFLARQYGGSEYTFTQVGHAALNPTSAGRERHIVFPRLEMNHAVPIHPGESGLMFASRTDVLENAPWSVFRPHLNGKDAVWLYLGEYEHSVVGRMTSEDFMAQGQAGKRYWGKHIVECRTQVCYMEMRARVGLRKVGLWEDGKEDATDKTVLNEEVERIRKKSGMDVSADDVIEALERGEESIPILLMKCVGYDRTFADDIEDKYPTWIHYWEKGSSKSKPKAEPSSSTKAPRNSKKAVAKAHRYNILGSDAEDSDSDFEDDQPFTMTTTAPKMSTRPRRKATARPIRARVTENSAAGASGSGMQSNVCPPTSTSASASGNSATTTTTTQGGGVVAKRDPYDPGYLSYLSEEELGEYVSDSDWF